ncbi:hypothetical protein BDP55DRAFT_85796 [Colletotrichum godetiae]|uniref:Uncharacterized protein n=1 Tax=Colletotrichum godetiae TaxID=1209918 RepID=A0AAJ0AP25_9PEZI|nr:uncharacterized protein BDP55DRAFT_85796 [Colletotrichum godetiae]KAK1687756.1 hypothetical protein BDP55DRAFT_85796 [Colletotrichum godetiae]
MRVKMRAAKQRKETLADDKMQSATGETGKDQFHGYLQLLYPSCAPSPPGPKSVWCLEHPFLSQVDHHTFSHSSPSVRSRRREAPLFSLLHNLTGLPGFHPHLVVLVLLPATRSVQRFVFISNLPSPYPLPIPPHPCAMGGKIVFSEHHLSVVLESGHTPRFEQQSTGTGVILRLETTHLNHSTIILKPHTISRWGDGRGRQVVKRQKRNEKGEKNRWPSFSSSLPLSCLYASLQNLAHQKLIIPSNHSPLRGHTTLTPVIASFPTLCVWKECMDMDAYGVVCMNGSIRPPLPLP